MAEGNVVGSAEFELRATRKKLADDLRQSERDVKGFMDRVENDADRSSKSIGNSFSGMIRGLTLGITALTAVFAAGLAMALKFGQASLKISLIQPLGWAMWVWLGPGLQKPPPEDWVSSRALSGTPRKQRVIHRGFHVLRLR